MSDWKTRYQDYCEKFAAELDLPFTFTADAPFQYAGQFILTPYMAFGHDPIADAKAIKH